MTTKMISRIIVGKEYWYCGVTVKVLEVEPKTFGRPQLVRLQDTAMNRDKSESTAFAKAFRSGAVPTKF